MTMPETGVENPIWYSDYWYGFV